MIHFFKQLIGKLVRCSGCELPLDFNTDSASFPLCQICAKSLFPCPALCPTCASPACGPSEASCLRPWVRHEGVDSFSALYLLLSQGYPVLRKWKIHRGLLFDHHVLKPHPSFLLFQEKMERTPIEAVIPVPQAYTRSWKMRGSPAARIAEWVGSQLNLPIIHPLFPIRRPKGGRRQAELSIRDRLQNPLHFGIHPHYDLHSVKNAILVDDFMTSGRTLSRAAQTLKQAGIKEIHTFCLGIRVPQLARKEEESPLPTLHPLPQTLWTDHSRPSKT